MTTSIWLTWQFLTLPMCESRYYVRLEEKQKNKKLFDLLDTLEFNQVGAEKCRFSISV